MKNQINLILSMFLGVKFTKSPNQNFFHAHKLLQ